MTDKLWLPGPQRPPKPRFLWNFRCSKKWADLTATNDPNVRDCGSCNEKVHYVTSFPAFLKFVEEGKCIATDLQDASGLFEEHRQDAAAPCVVAKDPPIVIDPRANMYQMPERMGRVDMVEKPDFMQKPDAPETRSERDDFGSRRLGRVVKRKRPEKEDPK